MSSLLPCFKAYDIRGRVPDVLNEVGWPRGWCQCYGYKPQDFKKWLFRVFRG